MSNRSKGYEYELVIQRGKRVKKPVTVDFLTQQKWVQPMLWIEEGKICCGIEVTDENEQFQGIIKLTTGRLQDPLVAYRHFCLLPHLPELSMDALSGALLLAHGDAVGELPDPETDPREKVRHQIGTSMLAEIMSQIPPDLEQYLRALEEKNVPIYIGSIICDVDAGLIPMSDYLFGIGVERSETVVARAERLEAKARQECGAHFRSYLKETVSLFTSISRLESFVSYAVKGYLVGINDVPTAVGMAVLQDEVVQSEITSLLDDLGDRLMISRRFKPANNIRGVSTAIPHVAAFLAREFHATGKTRDQYENLLSETWEKMKTMRVVAK